jgi:hypothetical protein
MTPNTVLTVLGFLALLVFIILQGQRIYRLEQELEDGDFLVGVTASKDFGLEVVHLPNLFHGVRYALRFLYREGWELANKVSRIDQDLGALRDELLKAAEKKAYGSRLRKAPPLTHGKAPWPADPDRLVVYSQSPARKVQKGPRRRRKS